MNLCVTPSGGSRTDAGHSAAAIGLSPSHRRGRPLTLAILRDVPIGDSGKRGRGGGGGGCARLDGGTGASAVPVGVGGCWPSEVGDGKTVS